MARFFVFAIAVSSVDGSCRSTARCSCDNSYNDKILGMHSHLLGKITKPVKEWKLVRQYPNKNNPGPRPVKLTLSYGHSKTQSTTWSVGIGAELKKIGINMDAGLAQMKSETWTEGVSEDIATTVKPYHSLNLYQKVFHQKVTWARRVDGGNDIKDCGGTYSFKSNVYQFSPTQPKADLSESETEVVVASGTRSSCIKTGDCAREAAACCSRFGHFTLNCANRTRCDHAPKDALEDAEPLAAGSVNITEPAQGHAPEDAPEDAKPLAASSVNITAAQPCFKNGACFQPEEKYVCFSKCCSKKCEQHPSCSYKPGAWRCIPKKDIAEDEMVI